MILNPISDNLPIHRVDDCRKIVISACRYDKQKNIKMGIHSFTKFFKNHEDYIYCIYGKGPEKKELEDYIKNIGMEKHIFINDFTNNIHELMADSSIFISSSSYEGLSNSMIEAMAIGLPVICTDCPIGGAREIINHEVNGVLVPLNDEYKMAYYLEKISDDLEFQRFLSNNAIQIRQQLAIEKICNKWKRVVETVVE